MFARTLPVNIQIEELSQKLAMDALQVSLLIERACFEEDLRYERSILWQLICREKVLIARDALQNEIVGYLIYRQRKNAYEVVCIGVEPDYQRQHIGAAMIAKLNAMSCDVTLMCRPYNEPFYRRLGFAPVLLPTYYHQNYYQYAQNGNSLPSVAVHGIFMRNIYKNKLPNEAPLLNSTVIKPDDAQFKQILTQLLAITVRTKNATSICYGSWFAGLFRSRRKEKAFDAIICELNAIGNDATMNRAIKPAYVLQSIIFNALVVRGVGVISKQTASGKALVKLLNSSEFILMRSLMTSNNAISYQDLQDFCRLNHLPKSSDTPKRYSPYRHF